MPDRALSRDRSWRVNFVALWVGQSVSLFGDAVSYVALPLFVAHLTGSALDLGLTSALETLPTLLLGFAAGVFLDRVSLRPVLMLTDLLRAAAFAALGLAILGGHSGVWMPFTVAFLAGSAKVFFDSGLQAYLPSVVPGDYLARANGHLQISQSLALPLGAALAGLLVATLDFSAAFGFNALTFVISAASLLLLRQVPERLLPSEHHFWPELREGLSFLWADVRLRLMTITAAVANFVVAPLEVTLILLAEREMGLTSSGIGFLFSVVGVGSVVGAVVAPRVVRWAGLGPTFVVGIILLGGGLFLASFAGSFLTGAPAIFLSFLGISWVQVALITFRQMATPAELLGRVTAASRTLAWASLPAGAALGGLLAEALGVVVLFRSAPLLLVVAGLALVPTSVWTAAVAAETSAGS